MGARRLGTAGLAVHSCRPLHEEDARALLINKREEDVDYNDAAVMEFIVLMNRISRVPTKRGWYEGGWRYCAGQLG